MSVKKDPSGRRSVEVEVEVPGTPEEVWQAIATGPGVSSWFVPTEGGEGEGAVVTAHFGPGMDSTSIVTAWDPPRRFVAESGDLGPNAPKVATEWIVEARSGGACVVRVVHSLFASNDDWDDQLGACEGGWPDFFRILRLYLTHFRGQPCSAMQCIRMTPEPEPSAWSTLTESLGLGVASVGERRNSPPGAPPLTSIVESAGEGNQLLLRLDAPAAGIAHLFAYAMGGQVCVAIRFYFYGERGAAAARDEPLWQAWIDERFPSPASAACGQSNP